MFCRTPVEPLGGKTMNAKVLLMDRDRIPDSLRTFVYRQLRKRRWDERQLAEQRTTKHDLEARKSCIPDARNYRVVPSGEDRSREKLRCLTLHRSLITYYSTYNGG